MRTADRAACPPAWRRRASRVLLIVGAAGLGVWTELPWGWWGLPDLAVGLGFVLTGLVSRAAGAGPDEQANGLLFIWTGLLSLANDITYLPIGPLPALGWLVRPLDEMLLLVILMRYPHGRIIDPVIRRTVPMVIAAALVPFYLSGLVWDPYADGWRPRIWWPTVFAANDAAHLLSVVSYFTAMLAAVTVVVLTVRRYRRSRGLDRRELVPVLVSAAAVGIAYVALQGLYFAVGNNTGNDVLNLATPLVVLTVPLAFAATALRRRLDRSAIADLVVSVEQPATVTAVRDGLRRALLDRSLQLYVWLPDQHVYTDGVDPVAVLPAADARDRLRRDVTDAGGGPLAVVLTDPILHRRADLVDAAVQAAALHLENARLHAALLAQMRELQQSRTRIVEAGVTQRRQVERDLHDGAQQRLLALAATIGRARTAATDPAMAALLEQARDELRRALKELRDLARGIHPAVLEQIGLAAAIEAVAEAMPLPVAVTVGADRLPPAVESTVYFVVCEALTNTVKHAAASRADVVVHHDGTTLRVTVTDDGTGGATTAPRGGLAGLADRAAALGGRFSVHSPAGTGTGTTLRLELPCAC